MIPDTAARRTPTERLYDALMASLHRTAAPPESAVTLSRNAKGATQIEVVVRGASAADCAAEASRLYDEKCAAYPYSTEGSS